MSEGADPLDHASENEYIARTFAQSIRKPEGPVANGKCFYCLETIAFPLRWCNADCRDDWQLTRKNR
jgi:hypothetical protein